MSRKKHWLKFWIILKSSIQGLKFVRSIVMVNVSKQWFQLGKWIYLIKFIWGDVSLNFSWDFSAHSALISIHQIYVKKNQKRNSSRLNEKRKIIYSSIYLFLYIEHKNKFNDMISVLKGKLFLWFLKNLG